MDVEKYSNVFNFFTVYYLPKRIATVNRSNAHLTPARPYELGHVIVILSQ